MREAIVSYVFLERNPTDTQMWFNHKPMELFRGQQKADQTQEISTMEYFKKNSRQISLLNSRFGMEKDSQGNYKLYALAASRFMNLIPPMPSFNSKHPATIRNGRIAIETAHVLVDFLKVLCPIPIVGPVVAKAFDWLVENPMQSLQHWEARLMAHLYLRSNVGENWDLALDMLGQEAINPFESSKTQREALIRARRQVYRIP
jgi:hypothetical protein